MGRSQETWNKQEKEKKKKRKKEEKLKRKEIRQDGSQKGSSLDDMIAWVDADGNPTTERPDPTVKRVEIKAEDIIIGTRPKEESEEETINEGTLTFFDESKGYGFIKVKNSNDSYFTHVKSHLEPLKEGNHVTFDVASGDKGPVAINVKVIR